MISHAPPRRLSWAMMRIAPAAESSLADSFFDIPASFFAGAQGNIRQRQGQRYGPRWGWYGAVAMAVMAGVMGCHATVGRSVGQQFISSAYAFEVPLPGNGWTSTSVDPSILTLTHPGLAAGISISVTCDRERQAPLTILARHLFFGFKEVEILRQEGRTLDGVAALQTLARARLEGAEVQVNSYVMQHQGCVYDLVCFASPRDYSSVEPIFVQMLAGFRFQSR